MGAHEGEELDDYVAAGKTSVLWVEANPNKYNILTDKISSYPDMRLGQFAAASLSGGSAVLNIASNSQSSSLLPFGSHSSSYPHITYVKEVSVDLCSIDDWVEEIGVKTSFFNFVNLDIQGYELNALRGMRRQLRHVDYVYTEVNFSEVYVGCTKISELDKFLAHYGLNRVAVVNAGGGWGDAFYSRNSHLGLSAWLFIWRLQGLPNRAFRGAKAVLSMLY